MLKVWSKEKIEISNGVTYAKVNYITIFVLPELAASISTSVLTEWDISNLLPGISLTLYVPIFPFYTPWKYQKIYGFPIFFGCIKMEHCDIKS